MKKKILTAAIFLTSFSLIVYAISAGGTQSDPIVTQSEVDSLLVEYIDDYLDGNLNAYTNPIETSVSNLISSTTDRICFVENDIISLDMGDKIVVRSGTYTLSGTGSVVNLSTGEEIINPTSLTFGVQYIVTENSNLTLTVTSLNSHIYIQGAYTYSNIYNVQYVDYANALYDLSLFAGSNYGYQLDRAATRIESLVMFIRLIGEEDEALAFTGTHNFTDVDAWADQYVAYAYNMGYTNGMTATEFGSTRYVRDLDYYTFILRALEYEDDIDFTWATAYEKALEIGIVPTDFPSYYELYRDHLVFVSYNALELKMDDHDYTLAEHLIDNGTISSQIYAKSQENLG
ncbi:MAG: hypothetical protein R3Y09_02135 [Clostridia bacterium]